MALIERVTLGSGTATAEGAPLTWYLDNAELARAMPIQYIDIALPAGTVLSSVQGSITSLSTPEIAPYALSSIGPILPSTGVGPDVLPGIQFIKVYDWFNQQYTFVTVWEAITLLGRTEVQRLLGNIPLGEETGAFGGGTALKPVNKSNTIWRFPTDGSYHFIVTIVRPRVRSRVPTFLNQVIAWYPYSLTYSVTGYVLNDHQQTQQVEQQVTCVVVDEVCQQLYGYRPGKEEQSDFIETQKQACRVGEAILWNAQMVISTEFAIAYNPAVRRGQTIRVRNVDENIDILGIVKDVSHTIRAGQSGQGLAAITFITLRSTEYIFRSALAVGDRAETLDDRQFA